MIVRVINIHEKTTNIFKMSVYRFGRRPYILCLSYYAMYTSTNLVFLRSIARSDFESSGYDTYKVFT